MTYPLDRHPASCVIAEIQPLLAELRDDIGVRLADTAADRASMQRYIRDVFRRAYAAELNEFYPHLLGFETEHCLRGVVGFRDGLVKPLFSEHYLDAPAEDVMRAHLQQAIARPHIAEVGNLALAGAGDARWLIAAMTVLLHAAGYRWVLFTAVPSLFNAFHRLGLHPIRLAAPDPRRLPDGGRQWGRYYATAPTVCAGDIAAGYHKLNTHISLRQPRLHALMEISRALGLTWRSGAQTVREAV